MPEAIWITFAFVLGLGVKAVGLPPLVGYLAAGFVLSGLSSFTGLAVEQTGVLEHVAHLGVLLLLFTVGLKLKLKSIVSPEVIGGGLLHFGITCLVFTPGLYWLLDLDWL
ncbi:MAG: sodium/hydrogen exchanger, partial [Marinobacter sp. T13-3]